MPMSHASLLQHLSEIGKTLDGDYVVSVRLENGESFDEVYVKPLPEGSLRFTARMDSTYIPIDIHQIAGVGPCPYRVPDAMALNAWKKGESGMGYFRLNILLRDGRELRNVIAGRPYVLRLGEPYSSKDIVRIEHAGYH